MRRKNILKTVWLTPEQNDALMKKVKTNVSDTIRNLIMDTEIKPINMEPLNRNSNKMKFLNNELKKIIFQINSYNYIDERKLRAIIRELNIMMKDIMNDLKTN